MLIHQRDEPLQFHMKNKNEGKKKNYIATTICFRRLENILISY